ncbi:right-handed parallel beta-helix repeat-containing protein [Bacillus cereus]|uniref:right-handed parallel beta-helix repeat-containing protein n=1 Tax=Bacillus cereus TaxID=1396 RepID=UPI001483A0F8|nr:right-handed parallel beta-helix repeat-containing protein [Bacillus cereus]
MVLILIGIFVLIVRYVGFNSKSTYVSISNVDTKELQQVISQSSFGDTVVLRGNQVISDTILIDKSDITIDGLQKDGSLAKLKTNTAIPIFTIKEGVSSVTIKNIILEGNLERENPKVYTKEMGINITGNTSNITLSNLQLDNFSGYGVYANLTKNLKINATKIKNFGYAGIMGFSVRNVEITNCAIGGALSYNLSSIGNHKIAYNVAFGRKSDNDIHKYPRSKDCIVKNSVIMDNVFWEGLDTHGGENIQFINNTIKNVKVPIAAVPSEVNGEDKYAPKDIKISNNVIETPSNELSNSVNRGIILSGTMKKSSDPDSKKEYATGVIRNNIISGYGRRDAYSQGKLLATGSIFLQSTKGARVSENEIFQSYYYGILAYYDNKDFKFEHNKISGLHVKEEVVLNEKRYPYPAGIGILSSKNTGQINQNDIRGNLEDPILEMRGIDILSKIDINVIATGNMFDKYIKIPYNQMEYDKDEKKYHSNPSYKGR